MALHPVAEAVKLGIGLVLMAAQGKEISEDIAEKVLFPWKKE